MPQRKAAMSNAINVNITANRISISFFLPSCNITITICYSYYNTLLFIIQVTNHKLRVLLLTF
jgi:hypothetical protein